MELIVELKNIADKKKVKVKKPMTNAQRYFKERDDYLNNTPDLCITLGGTAFQCKDRQEIENLIQSHLDSLIKSWNSKRKTNPTADLGADTVKMVNEFDELGDMSEFRKCEKTIDDDQVVNEFILILIARRLIIYVSHVLEKENKKSGLMEARRVLSSNKRFLDHVLLFSTKKNSPGYSKEEKAYIEKISRGSS